MAGDKGAEVPKSTQEYLQRPKAVKDTLDFYSKRPSGAFRASISRAIDSLRQRGRQLPSNETGQRFADKMDSGSAAEPSRDLDASDHARLRREVKSRQPGPRTEFNLRAHHELSSLGKKYFDTDAKSESTADEADKPSEE